MKPDLKGRRAVIVGFGKSGVSSAKRLLSLGASVIVTEKAPRENFNAEQITETASLGATLLFGSNNQGLPEGVDLLILSPGVHLDIPIVLDARKKGVEIISEIEFAFRLLKKPMIAVTGTNGKTTTTTLIGEMLKQKGLKAAVAGNIGHPLSDVNDDDLDLTVCEISSYQLETTVDIKPFISLMLNITEDHIERHMTMNAYAEAKSKIFANQGKDEYFIYNALDPIVSALAKKCKATTVPFTSSGEAVEGGIFLRGNMIVSNIGGNELEIIRTDEIFIKGRHNVENALAASAAALIAGCDAASIKKTLREFKGVEHRIEFVSTTAGVSFYNDSKGTNPDSTIIALRALGKNIILIAGGRDKGGSLSKLVDESRGRVKSLVLIGEAASRFHEAFSRSGGIPVFEEKSMEDAVNRAVELSKAGDHVLLSPACASFDMFKDYEDRGRIFKKLVHSLGGGNR